MHFYVWNNLVLRLSIKIHEDVLSYNYKKQKVKFHVYDKTPKYNEISRRSHHNGVISEPQRYKNSLDNEDGSMVASLC